MILFPGLLVDDPVGALVDDPVGALVDDTVGAFVGPDKHHFGGLIDCSQIVDLIHFVWEEIRAYTPG